MSKLPCTSFWNGCTIYIHNQDCVESSVSFTSTSPFFDELQYESNAILFLFG